jgi:hypothetical protein
MNVEPVVRVLQSIGAPHALIGGHAMAVRGYPRFTIDVDLLTSDARVLDPAMWAGLESAGASIDVRRGDTDDPLAGVVHILLADGTDVDLVVAKWTWESEVIDRAEPMSVAGISIPVPRTGDLVLLKLAAGGFIDLQDAAALLALDGAQDVVRDVETHIDQVRPDVRLLWRDLLATDELDELGIGHEALLQRERERLGECPAVVDRHLNLQRAEVEAPEAFGQPQHVAGGRAVFIDPRLILEALGLHHQRVALPTTHGIAVPPGLDIAVRQPPAVQEDFASAVVGFVEHHHEAGRLDDLPRLRVQVQLDRVQRQTVCVGVVLAVLPVSRGLQLHRPGQHRKLSWQRRPQIAKSLRRADAGEGSRRRHFLWQQALVPDTGQVRPAIRRAWGGREHVDATIRRPRRRGGPDRWPLRKKRRRHQQRGEAHEPARS